MDEQHSGTSRSKLAIPPLEKIFTESAMSRMKFLQEKYSAGYVVDDEDDGNKIDNWPTDTEDDLSRLRQDLEKMLDNLKTDVTNDKEKYSRETRKSTLEELPDFVPARAFDDLKETILSRLSVFRKSEMGSNETHLDGPASKKIKENFLPLAEEKQATTVGAGLDKLNDNPQRIKSAASNSVLDSLYVSQRTQISVNGIKYEIFEPSSESIEPGNFNSTEDTGIQHRRLCFRCKLCAKIFLLNCDHYFRRHLLTKHSVEVTSLKYLEDSKVELYPDACRCKSCFNVFQSISKAHSHHCRGKAAFESAFEEISNISQGGTVFCGICYAEFETRYSLKLHVDQVHPDFGKKIIVDPEYRCAGCLTTFEDGLTLGQHCLGCIESKPSQKSMLSLAKRLLSCDFCSERHCEIGDAQSCLLNRNIIRCILCLALFKNKTLYLQHLHDFHDVQLDPAEAWRCPICVEKVPEPVKDTTEHLIFEHFSPLLIPDFLTPTLFRNGNDSEEQIPIITSVRSMAVNSMLPKQLEVNKARRLSEMVKSGTSSPDHRQNIINSSSNITSGTLTSVNLKKLNFTRPRTLLQQSPLGAVFANKKALLVAAEKLPQRLTASQATIGSTSGYRLPSGASSTRSALFSVVSSRASSSGTMGCIVPNNTVVSTTNIITRSRANVNAIRSTAVVIGSREPEASNVVSVRRGKFFHPSVGSRNSAAVLQLLTLRGRAAKTTG